MYINDDHMYHGAALTQIAEHPHFTAINPVRLGDDQISRSAFLINDGIVAYMKYVTARSRRGDDYQFTFDQSQKEELTFLDNIYNGRVFIALICVDERHICCISFDELQDWLDRRNDALGNAEEASSAILVQLQPGQRFRVNMNDPRERGYYLDNPQIVPRNRFPGILFEQ